MKYIDEITQTEIANPDLTLGELSPAHLWASPEAYATIDNVTKFALDDDDYEEVQIYHVWTAADKAKQIKDEVYRLKQQLTQSDYVMAKCVEDMLEVDGIVALLRVFKSYATTYKQVIADRKAWRERINELEN